MVNNRLMRNLQISILVTILLALASCSDKKSATPTNTSATKPAPAAARRGTIRATPNPIQVCSGNAGKTTIIWEATGVKNVEVRIGSPDGTLFGSSLNGSWPSGDWVANGLTFYLQDVSDGLPLTKDNTLASVAVMHTKDGCK